MIVSAVALVAGGIYLARAMHRAKHDLVTLNVREMPLAKVLAELERQTREKIVAHQSLDAKLTLNVKATPLPEALDLIAYQSESHWSAVRAVSANKSAQAKLEQALRTDGNLPTAGWTNLFEAQSMASGHAVEMFDAEPPSGGQGQIVRHQPAPGVQVLEMKVDSQTSPATPTQSSRGGTGSGNKAQVFAFEVKPGMKPEEMEAEIQRQLKAQGIDEATGNAPVIIEEIADDEPGPDGGGTAQSFLLNEQGQVVDFVQMEEDGSLRPFDPSHERLMLENQLVDRLGEHTPQSRNAEAAKKLAQVVKGKVTQFYLLESAPGGMAGMNLFMDETTFTRSETNEHGAFTETAIISDRFQSLDQLTPEQRAKRARTMSGTAR